MKWTEICPNYSLEDAEMLAEIKKCLHIVDYSLCADRFPLKNTPFTAKFFMEARLPIVLQKIRNALLCLAPYSDIGIKTTLGMGGVKVFYPKK